MNDLFSLDDAQQILNDDGAFTAQDAQEILGPQDFSTDSPQDPTVAGAGVASSFLTGINRGIARTLGTPVDLINSLFGVIGLDSERPVGGSAQLEDLFAQLGFIRPVESEFAARVGETVGGGITTAVPMLGLGSRLPGAVGQSIDAVRQFAARRPTTFMAGELATSTSAGVGGATAEHLFPGNPAAEIAGEILGGSAPGLLAFAPTGAVLKAIRKAAVPFTKSGALARAGERMRQIVGDPDEALRNIDQFSEFGLTPAQASLDPGLLALEQAVIRTNRKLGVKYEQQAALSNRIIQQNLRDVAEDASIFNTREFLDKRRQYLVSLLETRKANAVALAQERMEKIKPRISRQQANLILREELEKALDDARAQENALWAAVPRKFPVTTATTRNTLEDILRSRGLADDPEDIPGFVTQLIGNFDDNGVFKAGKLGESTTVGELQTLRSRILREIRAERAKPAPNRRKIGILEDLQGSILQDLGAETPQNEVGTALRAALDFSHDLNERFTRGPVGRLLGFERRGGPALDPRMTAERLLAPGGATADVGIDAILRAADTPQTRGAVEDFMRNLFVTQATDRNGRVTPAAAERFLTQHAAVLDRFPDLRRALMDAKEAQRIATETAARMDARTASLYNKKLSRAALFLGAPVDREIDAVLRSGNPRAAMAELVKQASKDPDGLALKGLKSGYIEHLIRRAEQNAFDIEGQPLLSGRRMQRLLHDEIEVITPLFNAQELQRLNQLTRAAAALEASLKTAPLEAIIDDRPSLLVGLIARTLGARIGARLGAETSGSTLVTASAGSRFLRNIVERLSLDRAKQLLSDAVTEDPELFRSLLIEASSPRRIELIQKRINAWLVTSGERAFDDERGEPTN